MTMTRTIQRAAEQRGDVGRIALAEDPRHQEGGGDGGEDGEGGGEGVDVEHAPQPAPWSELQVKPRFFDVRPS